MVKISGAIILDLHNYRDWVSIFEVRILEQGIGKGQNSVRTCPPFDQELATPTCTLHTHSPTGSINMSSAAPIIPAYPFSILLRIAHNRGLPVETKSWAGVPTSLLRDQSHHVRKAACVLIVRYLATAASGRILFRKEGDPGLEETDLGKLGDIEHNRRSVVGDFFIVVWENNQRDHLSHILRRGSSHFVQIGVFSPLVWSVLQAG